MKIKIEKSDIKEVISIAKDYYGIILAPAQALELIQKNTSLQEELIMQGGLDTVGRETLSDCMVHHIMKGCPPPENKDKWSIGWHWPHGGSTEEYTNEFYKKFKETALVKGYKMRDEK